MIRKEVFFTCKPFKNQGYWYTNWIFREDCYNNSLTLEKALIEYPIDEWEWIYREQLKEEW